MTPTKRATVYVALLRGINLGGKNKLPMKDLAAMLEAAGCTDVQTYIQSGNVVFRATKSVAARVSKRVTAAIADRFGYDIPVVLREAREVRAVLRGNPFAKPGVDEKTLHVAFLADKPTAATIKTLDPDRSPSDEYVVRGREIYLHLPNGVGRTKLTNAYFDARLGTVSTWRNWRTVQRLGAMAGD